jgi:hypothetical protein
MAPEAMLCNTIGFYFPYPAGMCIHSYIQPYEEGISWLKLGFLAAVE